MKIALVIISGLFGAGCLAQTADQKVTTKFFPTHQDGEKGEGVSEFEAEWYSKSLKRMEEPSLWPAAKEAFAIRFLILPTWGNSISVRAIKEGDRYRLIARRLGGQAGYDPGKLVESKEVLLNVDDSKKLDAHLDAAKIFELATDDKVHGKDGDQWIVETVKDGKYRIMVRWTPSYDTAKRKLTRFVGLCDYLISASTLAQRPMNRGHEIMPKSK